MTTPARTPLAVADFEALVGFPLDPFQGEAVEAYLRGQSVLVAAPTGTGKTAIAEFAVSGCAAAGRPGDLHHADQGALEPEAARLPELLERAAERGLIDQA